KTGMMQDLLGDYASENHEKLPVLGNVQIINGGTPNTQDTNYWNGNIGWLSVEDFNTGHRYVYSAQKKITEAGLKNSSTAILKTGQIIISARGTVGVVAQMGNDLAFNQSCYGLNSFLHWTNDFLYYYLLFISDKIRSITHGNVFGTIIKNTFKDIFIPLIPKPIQDEIVDALSSVDARIEAERDYLAKLLDIKKGLMQDLLTNTVSVDPLL
ncbi:MAG: restriction endonuclease subunit S, partial [Clostridiales bacterium]|nr:restriction endonuclease subunit S [Clostridiales bacterium]